MTILKKLTNISGCVNITFYTICWMLAYELSWWIMSLAVLYILNNAIMAKGNKIFTDRILTLIDKLDKKE